MHFHIYMSTESISYPRISDAELIQYRGIPIRTIGDLDKIKYLYEREYIRFLLESKPRLQIIYEPKPFHGANPKKRHTIPDFLIIDPVTQYKFYLEKTRTEYVNDDPKARQKRLMKQLSCGIPYTVIYGGNLSALQSRYPQYNFFEKR